jgi:hypothetical protein
VITLVILNNIISGINGRHYSGRIRYTSPVPNNPLTYPRVYDTSLEQKLSDFDDEGNITSPLKSPEFDQDKNDKKD